MNIAITSDTGRMVISFEINDLSNYFLQSIGLVVEAIGGRSLLNWNTPVPFMPSFEFKTTLYFQVYAS
jgi:hypothetical protein